MGLKLAVLMPLELAVGREARGACAWCFQGARSELGASTQGGRRL